METFFPFSYTFRKVVTLCEHDFVYESVVVDAAKDEIMSAIGKMMTLGYEYQISIDKRENVVHNETDDTTFKYVTFIATIRGEHQLNIE